MNSNYGKEIKLFTLNAYFEIYSISCAVSIDIINIQNNSLDLLFRCK